ncbi:hypothetical protein AB4865_04275 [Capnocytophaga sp. ARDL2]|uniref:hypothetical protein n=1 Tax=Capnocytophaga sp. ARDL2 TaxID=3238809 RepID=UPI003557C2C1
MENTTNDLNNPHVLYVREKSSNSMGIAGFVFAILASVLSFIPILNFILWLMGAIFSMIGVFRRPRGFAIAGLVISFFWIIVFIIVMFVLVGAATVIAV